MSKGRNGSRKKVRCFRCKKLGHFKRDCLVAEGDLPKGHKAKVSMDSSEDDGALLAGGLIAGWWNVCKLNRGLGRYKSHVL